MKPLTGIAPWTGGKRLLGPKLAALIDKTPHHCYAEPFAGMGGVFFRRSRRPRVEVLNDYNGDVVNVYRVIKYHPQALFQELRGLATARGTYEDLRRLPGLTDIQRAASFLYKQCLCFGGKPGHGFGTSARDPKLFNFWDRRRQWLQLHRRLAGTVIEGLDFETFIQRYDKPGTLFYCDPPYVGTEDYYGRELYKPADLQRLAEALRSVKGTFILSINDCPQTRDAFAWATLKPVAVWHGVSGAKRVGELIIRPKHAKSIRK